MVALTAVQSSNANIAATLPPGLVAVFIGATSGIGEYTLKAFAKNARQPRVYFCGRSQQAADRITKECQALNPEGEFIFIKADVSLMKNVDDVCLEIKGMEKMINFLCLSQGTLSPTGVTSEGLRDAIALAYYSRARFIINLLPLLQQASSLRRVLSIFAGGKEGSIDMNDIKLCKATNPFAARGHLASMLTLSMESLAKRAPDVSFIHNFPGPVKSNIARDKNVINFVMRNLFAVIGPFVNMPEEECGERHLFLATSARYPARDNDNAATSTSLDNGVVVAQGTDGKESSGVYTPDAQGESAGPKVVALLAKLRDEGVVEKLWEHTETEFTRICGTVAI